MRPDDPIVSAIERVRRDFESPLVQGSRAFFIAARRGRVLQANPAMLDALGYTAGEICGADYVGLLAPAEDQESLRRVGDLAHATKLPLSRETRVVARDGRVLHIEWLAWPMLDARGEIDYFLATGLDLTGRRQAEAELERTGRYWQSIFNAVSDAIAVVDESGVIVDGNARLAVLTGRTLAELRGHAVRELFGRDEPPFTADAADERVRRAVAGEEQLFEWPGRSSWVEVNLRRAALQDQVRLIAVVRDISRRKLAQEALRASEEKFRTLAEQSLLGIAIYRDGRLLYVNDVLARLCGASRDEMIRGWGAAEIARRIHPDDLPLAMEAQQRRLEGWEEVGRYDLRIMPRPDGEVRWVSVFSRVIPFEGQPAIEAVVLDITERKRAEEERRALQARIEHAQKLESLGVLAGGIAHDFNNLLVGVLGNAGLALAELPDDSPALRSVEQIAVAAQRAAELTQQLLAHSGRGRLVVQAIDLNRVISEMAHLLQVSISKRAALRQDLDPDLPPVEADATQLRQVIMNLITNACESLEGAAGVVAVRTGRLEADRAYLSSTYLDEGLPEGRYVYLEVEDAGCGIDSAALGRIFDPFFTTKATGRGLGLAAVLGIVRGHRGAIKVSSTPGQGTTFRVLFPAARAARPVDEQRATPTTWRGHGTVLVVDDEPIARDVARRTLERCGFAVLAAADGRAGVELFAAHVEETVAVVLDMTMPGMSGDETLRELRRIRPGIRVILSSGYSEQDATAGFGAERPSGFLQKPYRPAQLVELLRGLVEANI